MSKSNAKLQTVEERNWKDEWARLALFVDELIDQINDTIINHFKKEKNYKHFQLVELLTIKFSKN